MCVMVEKESGKKANAKAKESKKEKRARKEQKAKPQILRDGLAIPFTR